MLSKKWQRNKETINNLAIAIGLMGPFLLLALPVVWWIKVLLIAAMYTLLVVATRWLLNSFATEYVKAVQVEYEEVSARVKSVLTSRQLGFTKQAHKNKVIFRLDETDLILTVEHYPLYQEMIVEPLAALEPPKSAALLTIKHKSAKEAKQTQELRNLIDESLGLSIS